MSDTQSTAWPQIVLRVSKDTAQDVEDNLFACGALSITYLDNKDQPVLEPAPGEVRLWDEMQIQALFAQSCDADELQSEIARALNVDSLPEGSFSMVADQQWERVWMDQFHPMQFGRKLWICPTHCDPTDSSAINLRLDPGLAFGSGTHATTALCLEWLDQHADGFQGKELVDFGCGSGVLAIAALLLGAGTVFATDIDPQAMQASAENAVLNKVASQLKLVLHAELVDNQYDMLLANILYQPLCDLRDDFHRMLKPRAPIVLSGVLEEQAASLIKHYENHFCLNLDEVRDDWVRLVGYRL